MRVVAERHKQTLCGGAVVIDRLTNQSQELSDSWVSHVPISWNWDEVARLGNDFTGPLSFHVSLWRTSELNASILVDSQSSYIQ